MLHWSSFGVSLSGVSLWLIGRAKVVWRNYCQIELRINGKQIYSSGTGSSQLLLTNLIIKMLKTINKNVWQGNVCSLLMD